MKTRIYLRVAKTKKGAKVAVSMRPSREPVNGNKKYYPTVVVGLDPEE